MEKNQLFLQFCDFIRFAFFKKTVILKITTETGGEKNDRWKTC